MSRILCLETDENLVMIVPLYQPEDRNSRNIEVVPLVTPEHSPCER